jgi:SAM-dependent methyltransferase
VNPEYVASQYWEEIFAQVYDESAVGFTNLSRSLNRARYDVERRNVLRALKAAGLERPPRRVLDVGSGTGVWIDFWRQRGATEIVGLDLTDTAVARLRVRYPQHQFLQCDVGDAHAALPGPMDIVSAMSVLLHITDEARFAQAMRNLMNSVRAGGHLVLVEPLVVNHWWGPPFGPSSNSIARPLGTYRRMLEDGGFRIVHLRPASCLLTNVADTRRQLSFRLLQDYWHLLSHRVGRRETAGALVAGVLRPIDLLLTRVAPHGPAAKVLIAERSETS